MLSVITQVDLEAGLSQANGTDGHTEVSTEMAGRVSCSGALSTQLRTGRVLSWVARTQGLLEVCVDWGLISICPHSAFS